MKLNLTLKLPGIRIFCNRLNWVLQVGDPNNREYFASLDDLCDEIFDLRLQMKASTARRIKTDIRSLAECVRDARQATSEDLDVLKTLIKNADRARRKGLFGSQRLSPRNVRQASRNERLHT